MKIIRVTMPDGSEWDVPAELIAKDRANYYAEHDGGNKEKTYKEEFSHTLSDHADLLDWASNNMNWEDVQSAAKMHKAGSVDYEEGWCNGDKKVITL